MLLSQVMFHLKHRLSIINKMLSMKNLFTLILIATVLFSCQKQLSPEQSSQLWKAYKEHNYFRLDKLVSALDSGVSTPEVLLFKAKLGYVFNKPEASNHAINQLLEKYPREFNDTLVSDFYLMRSVNFTRLENYKQALVDGNAFIDKHSKLYDSTFIAETKDDNLVREALTDVPKMEVIPSDVQIPIHRDMAGLINLPVVLRNDSVDFVFDSGANMSVIVTSVAEKYGFKPLGKKIYVLAITGKRMEAQLALVNLKMGSIEIKNSPFIVFPDSLLSFANGAYNIKGIIGFPIMNALKQFTVKDDQFLIIPKTPAQTTSRNFALDQSTPVIMVTYQNDTLPFHFDTGANSSLLYSTFFNKYKDFVLQNCKKQKDQVGGAGGTTDVEAYILGKASFEAGGVKTDLDSLRILTKSLMSNQDNLYGNFGQDFMKKYKVMTVNFEGMNIRFE